MNTYTNVNGAPFADEDIERWAAEDESAEGYTGYTGYTGRHLGASRPGVSLSTLALRCVR